MYIKFDDKSFDLKDKLEMTEDFYIFQIKKVAA